MKHKKLQYILCTVLFLFSAHYLGAEQNLSPKEEALISHVQMSIANAQHGVSKLNPAILKIEGMSSSIIRHFLNNICSLKGSNYLEIGCWKGSTLIAATYKNERNLQDIVAIDNWLLGTNAPFLQNIKTFLPTTPVRFFEADCFAIDKSKIFHQPVNIYFYDGEHYYNDQKSAFTFYDEILDNSFIAIIDDWNWSDVQNGTRDAFRELDYQVLYEQQFFTPYNGDTSSWWNGFYIAVIRKTKTIQ